MDALTAIFSHVCGQGHALVIDGAAMPVCARCFGLYAGAAATGLWLLASGAWRRGLPDRSVVFANIAMLLTAMLGGLHVIDAGPAWRLLCGLWTGHVAILWLVGGAVHLRRLAQPMSPADPPWPRGLRWQALAAGPALAVLAVALARWGDDPHIFGAGWYVCASLVVLGAGAILAALATAALATVGWAATRAGPTLQESLP